MSTPKNAENSLTAPDSRPASWETLAESHEGLECLKCPEPHVFPVSPVSKGQDLEVELKGLAARNACTGSMRPEDNSWELARDLKAVPKRIGWKLSIPELMLTFDEWHSLSGPFLDAEKSRDQYWMGFLAQLQKVRVPAGEGTVNEALQYVSKLTEADLPVVPGYGNAIEPRKIAALHRELARRSKKKDKRYCLSYRDAAKVCDGLSHQGAHTITFALASVGVIDIVSNGKAGLNSGKAAEFRYLLQETESAKEDDEIPV